MITNKTLEHGYIRYHNCIKTYVNKIFKYLNNNKKSRTGYRLVATEYGVSIT